VQDTRHQAHHVVGYQRAAGTLRGAASRYGLFVRTITVHRRHKCFGDLHSGVVADDAIYSTVGQRAVCATPAASSAEPPSRADPTKVRRQSVILLSSQREGFITSSGVSAWSLDLPRVLSNLRDRLLALLGWGGYLTARLATRRSTPGACLGAGRSLRKTHHLRPVQLGDRFTPVFLCRLGVRAPEDVANCRMAGTYPAVREE